MKRSRITGMVGTVLLHALVLLLLFLYTLELPDKQEEGGVPVMLGDTELAQGYGEEFDLTEVDVLPEPEVAPEPEIKEPDVEQPLITQTEESSVAIKKTQPEPEKKPESEKKPVSVKKPVKSDKKPVREDQKPEVQKPVSQKPKEKTEAEKRAEAERAAAKAAAGAVANAFGKGSQMGSKGVASSETGTQGSAQGNAASGSSKGIGGHGTFDLNGRHLGAGGLPVPVYNVQDEGRVVITIVVNPAGKVVGTSINKRTNTMNPALRRAAEEAARKARFNAVDGVNNQTGTITYYFKLK